MSMRSTLIALAAVLALPAAAAAQSGGLSPCEFNQTLPGGGHLRAISGSVHAVIEARYAVTIEGVEDATVTVSARIAEHAGLGPTTWAEAQDRKRVTVTWRTADPLATLFSVEIRADGGQTTSVSNNRRTNPALSLALTDLLSGEPVQARFRRGETWREIRLDNLEQNLSRLIREADALRIARRRSECLSHPAGDGSGGNW